MPFELLNFHNRHCPSGEESRAAVFSLPRLRDRDMVRVGVSNTFPVLRIGHFLIKYVVPPRHRHNIQYTNLFIGEVRGGPLVSENREVFYQLRLADLTGSLEPRNLLVIDTKARSTVPRSRIRRTIEGFCFGGGYGLHRCDRGGSMGAGSPNQWFIQPQ